MRAGCMIRMMHDSVRIDRQAGGPVDTIGPARIWTRCRSSGHDPAKVQSARMSARCILMRSNSERPKGQIWLVEKGDGEPQVYEDDKPSAAAAPPTRLARGTARA